MSNNVIASLSNGLKLYNYHFQGCARGECMFTDEEILSAKTALEDQSNMATAQKRSFLEYSIEFVPVARPDGAQAKKKEEQVVQLQKSVTEQLMTLVNTIPNIKLLKGPEHQNNVYRRSWPTDPLPLVNLATVEQKIREGVYPGGIQQLVKDLYRAGIQHGRRAPPGNPLWAAANKLIELLDMKASDFLERPSPLTNSVYYARLLSHVNKEAATEMTRLHHQTSLAKVSAMTDDSIYDAPQPANPVDAAPKPKRVRPTGTPAPRVQEQPLSSAEMSTMIRMFVSLLPKDRLDVLDSFRTLSYKHDTNVLEFAPDCPAKHQRFIFDYIRRLKDEQDSSALISKPSMSHLHDNSGGDYHSNINKPSNLSSVHTTNTLLQQNVNASNGDTLGALSGFGVSTSTSAGFAGTMAAVEDYQQAPMAPRLGNGISDDGDSSSEDSSFDSDEDSEEGGMNILNVLR
eukprot:GDKJ01025880.1.p1 GENE.GDKJ01025880.1~~GDKJ01025880.1.p1  ORF type:complete len:458 (-),score=92.04 GDKJ01025880.1:81-1454(-)